MCAELAQPITHPPCNAAQVDIQCKIEISWNFYWPLWGNQAVAAANLIGFGVGGGTLQKERGNSQTDDTEFTKFPVNKQEQLQESCFVSILTGLCSSLLKVFLKWGFCF